MKKLTNSELIEQFKKVHGDIYIYDDLQYVNKMTKVKIYCKKHGYFEQLPSNHLKGNGCPQCAREKKFSNYTDIKKQMQKIHNYKYEYDDSTHKDTHTKMKMICPIHLDFYLPEYNIAIECQGGQHYKPCTFGGISKEEAEERLKYRIELDKRKALLCKENDLPLEYIDYNENVEQRINEIIEKYKIS